MLTPKLINTLISSGTALSAAASIGDGVLVGILMPAGWDAAAMTFQISVDGVSFFDMQSSSAVVSFTVAAAQYIAVDPALWRGVTALKVRSGTAGAPVNQTADRTVGLVTSKLV